MFDIKWLQIFLTPTWRFSLEKKEVIFLKYILLSECKNHNLKAKVEGLSCNDAEEDEEAYTSKKKKNVKKDFEGKRLWKLLCTEKY